MAPRAAPALTLVLFTSLVPELLTGSTPAPAMAAGAVVIFVLAYGLPILALREIAARTGAGFPGLFVMGLGYGLVNEGLYARTIFRATGLPLPAFDGMAMVGGVNLGFAAVILCWHALSSVVLPVALAEALWPGRSRLWLGRGAVLAVAVVSVAAASVFFVAMEIAASAKGAAVAVALGGQWTVIAGLVGLGSRIAARDSLRRTSGPAGVFLLGLGGAVVFILSVLPAETGRPLWLSLAVLGVLVVAYGGAIARMTGGAPRLLSWFGGGWYAMTALFSAFTLAGASPVSVIVNMLVLGVVLWMATRARGKA